MSGPEGERQDKDPLIGQTFGGRYSIVRRLGEGGMGNVYEGQHALIGKRVAIKVLHPEFAANEADIKRFVNEARAAATLRHPHIIDASDVGTTTTGEPFIVLEFLEGRELADLLDEVGPLPVARAVRILRQVVSALEAAHAMGIVHRDLKPQNVFLLRRTGNEDFVKVLDFGISKFRQGDGPALTTVGSQLGTPAYMAPEQFLDSSQVDARADIYSAGVMLYKMLIGALPFSARSYPELLAKVMSGSSRPMRELRPGLPDGILEVVAKAMAVAKEQRYSTMAEFDAALEPWERHVEPALPPYTRAVRTPKEQPEASEPSTRVARGPSQAAPNIPVTRIETSAGQPPGANIPVTRTGPVTSAGPPVTRIAPVTNAGPPVTRVAPVTSAGPPVTRIEPAKSQAVPAGPPVTRIEPGTSAGPPVTRNVPVTNAGPPVTRIEPGTSAGPPVTRIEPGEGQTGGGIWTSPASTPVAGNRRCPNCNERAGRDAECPHCGEELPDLRLGETIGQRYRVERLLGAGGMGRVYLGNQLAFDEPVAIKFLLAEWTSRGEFRARFKREAMTLAKLRHPGIVTVHDYGEHEGELFMVMEFVKGRDLRGAVPEGEAVPAPRALQLIDLVLQVIEFAHAHGIVHRDLKPENVMMLDLGDRVDRVKVLDFGLALATDTVPAERLTATDTVQGTPTYMSPEQCKGRDVGPPTDIYALGVMLYEWLCGDVPFSGGAVSETMAQQMYLAPPSLADRGRRPAIPASVEALVRAALAKQPEARPSATEFRERIAQILRGDDSVSRAERAASQRADDAALSREDRLKRPAAAPAAPGAGATGTTVSGCVVVWGVPTARATDLSTNFAVNGCAVRVWSSDELPPSTVDGQSVKAIVVQWTPAVPQRVQAIRAYADLAKVAVIVLDTPEVDATPALIRAGATDVQYPTTAVDTICKQTLKLMRRVK